ncbi:MAG: PD-(D/E)XK nuclease family transposase [Lachnospiraceae bacterium]|nr:PD-(D/E)XK nuclease family transposase [Lachnospiraceae bacterium]
MAETIQYKEETLRILDELCLLDDDFMTMAFDENIKATELLLNIVLKRDDMEVIRVEKHEVQKEMKNPLVGGRGIRLDVYAKDYGGRTYDIEVQQSDSGADVHRARFNSAMLDIRMLKAGDKFSDLNESYVIFITRNDVVGAGLPIYHADRVFKETGADFGDGNHIVYVNGSYTADSPIGRLMHDFRSQTADGMYYSELADQVRFYKEIGNCETSSQF